MKFMPEINYNADLKIWNSPEQPEYFSKDLSVGEVIFHEMQRHPQLIAQISDSENTILTREELFLNSKRVASYLRNLELQQSDIVGIIARNTTHIFAVAYGCFFNGIAFHSLNINYEQEKIEKLFDITEPKIIFCDGDEYEKVKAATEKLNVKIVTMRNHKEGSISIEEVLTTPIDENFQPAQLEQGKNQNLAILCTSGTTGTPKAVTVSNDAKSSMFPFMKTSDVLFIHSNLDWITGVFMTIVCGIRSVTRIISDRDLSAAHILGLIRKHKVTILFTAPRHMAQMVNCPEFEEDCLDSLNYFIYTGSACSIEVQQSIRRRLSPKCALVFAYGITEFGTIAFNFHFDQKPNSVGRPTEGVSIKILNDKRESLGPNQTGEVCLYSRKYWAGYYGNVKDTRINQENKLWYPTGDLGYIDEDGFLFLVDRIKDMLKYLGNQYYPQNIEKIISEMPEVSEVCVFGIDNPLCGDEAAAAVVKKLGSDLDPQDVIDFVAKNVKAIYLQLHGGVFIVDDLKRSPNGKTHRQATKELCLEMAKKN